MPTHRRDRTRPTPMPGRVSEWTYGAHIEFVPRRLAGKHIEPLTPDDWRGRRNQPDQGYGRWWNADGPLHSLRWVSDRLKTGPGEVHIDDPGVWATIEPYLECDPYDPESISAAMPLSVWLVLNSVMPVWVWVAGTAIHRYGDEERRRVLFELGHLTDSAIESLVSRVQFTSPGAFGSFQARVDQFVQRLRELKRDPNAYYGCDLFTGLRSVALDDNGRDEHGVLTLRLGKNGVAREPVATLATTLDIADSYSGVTVDGDALTLACIALCPYWNGGASYFMSGYCQSSGDTVKFVEDQLRRTPRLNGSEPVVTRLVRSGMLDPNLVLEVAALFLMHELLSPEALRTLLHALAKCAGRIERGEGAFDFTYASLLGLSSASGASVAALQRPAPKRAAR